MTTGETLRATLLAYAPLAALVQARVRFDIGEVGDEYPFVICRQIANEPVRGIDGSLHARRESFQVESWAETRAAASATHAQVEAALDAAELFPEPADPDSLDPEIGARAGVWTVDIWT